MNLPDLGRTIDPNTMTYALLSSFNTPSQNGPPIAAASSPGASMAPMPPLSESPSSPLQTPSSQLPTLVGGDLLTQFNMPIAPAQAVSVVNSSEVEPSAAPGAANAPRDLAQAAPVPEPSTLALLLAVALGTGGRAIVRRRRALASAKVAYD